ncbi:MAG: hypothetical protein KatS3mg057_0040 [Herpetosiphonaceae bacterium]|nr:MAG: hypothetical protein KatS3mg057_0040 [Herpetosiphonaceae bacterium]
MSVAATVVQTPELRIPHLAELLRWRAERFCNQRAYTFLGDGGVETGITYGELDQWARAIASVIIAQGGAGEPMLVVCPPGLDYIAAFFGCLYAGAIAVPAYSPTTARTNRTLPRLQAIVADAQARLALTTTAALEVIGTIKEQAPELSRLSWITVDAVPAGDDLPDLADPGERPAFLMYTSGSTGTPKGVIVSHASALHNARSFPGFRSRPCTGVVSWLPLFHDLGLFLGVIHPLYRGAPAVLMSPTDFARHPLRWLEAMSRFRASTTGGPNFAYELCVRKSTPEQRAALDLRAWNLALNGAEPIRPETIIRFTEAFAPSGFRPETFYPSYGLADATATVTGASDFAPPLMLALERESLAQRRVKPAQQAGPNTVNLVGCGGGLDDQVIQIVDPDTLEPCPADRIGEIWVSGPSIGQGYWNRPKETEQVFHARLADTGDRVYLRTGDLGFLHRGELFIAGRLKDLIIIRGQNHYPEDIEQTIERSHPALRAGCGAAFALEVDGEERLAIVQEVEGQPEDSAPIIAAIRQAVIEYHDIPAYRVVLIRAGSIPKTSSGKIQRSLCRERLLAGELPVLADWQHQPMNPADREALAPTTIENWIVNWLARQLGIHPTAIDTRAPLSSYDLDSLSAVAMVGELEQWLGRRLSPTVVWSYPTVEALVSYLASETTPASAGLSDQDSAADEPIAIIGMGCRFPNAPDVEAFWQLLIGQIDAIEEVPPSRWDAAALYHPDPRAPGKVTTRWGGFLADADAFDASLFGISPREAIHIDPQQRLLLEVAWAALEHAGEAPDRLAGSATGVFIGICNSDHARLELEDHNTIDQYGGTGTAYSLVANRLSYTLDLRGPSLAIDTACSSSLVALHLACQSLRNGECERALAGGVNLVLSPEITIAFSKARMMAGDGRCKTFDSRADGYVRSEGVGMLVLKRLSRALADGDRVLALVRGTAINQDGRSNGITAPNGLAQQAVIRQTLQRSKIGPDQLGYIEAHGTGTPLGDAIEIEAWKHILGTRSTRVPIGSVKTNIGHTEAAAGVAGVIKVVLAMMHGTIPPQLHLQTPNPQLHLEDTALEVAVEPRPWPADPAQRFASVSSFGFGGTNAHVILERMPVQEPMPPERDRSHHLLVLSGRDERALVEQARRMAGFLVRGNGLSLADVCHTAGRGRAQLNHRLALVAASTAQASEMLSSFVNGDQPPDLWHGEVTSRGEKIVFVFTGQGSQYPQMGRQLYESHPLFRATIDECQRLLEPYLDAPLLHYLYPDSDDQIVAEDAWPFQPALFAVEYALARLWMSWGVQPTTVLGHSLGEYVAACIAGVYSLADALKLVTHRAKLVERLPKDGAMAAVMAPAEVVHAYLARFDGTISVASYNNPGLVIVTGRKEDLQMLGAELQRAEITFRPLPIANAFHSPAMRPIAGDFAAITKSVQYSAPRLPLVANLTGTLATPDQLGPDYWVRHLMEPVHFQQSIECLVEQGYRIFIEMGPRPTLVNMIKRIVPSRAGYLVLSSLSGLADQPDWAMMMSALGQLYIRGIDIDWRAVDQPYQRSIISLPTYPFERQRYPIGRAERRRQSLPRQERLHPLIDQEIVAPQIKGAVFQRRLAVNEDSFLDDHNVQGRAVLPGAAQIEMMLAAAAVWLGRQPSGLANLAFTTPLAITDTALIQATIEPADEHGRFQARIVSREERSGWVQHATAEILADGWADTAVDLAALRRRCPRQLVPDDLYAQFSARGIVYGRSFRTLCQVWIGDHDVLAEIALDADAGAGYRLPPALLDGALQCLAALLNIPGDHTTFVPFAIGEIRLATALPVPPRLLCHGVRVDTTASDMPGADLTLLDDNGRVLGTLRGIRLRRLAHPPAAIRDVTSWIKRLRWRSCDLPPLDRPLRRSWLLLSDSLGLGETLKARLIAQNDRCVCVLPGDSFQKIDGGYTVRPDKPDDYAALAEALAEERIDAVLHLWAYTPPLGMPKTAHELDAQLARGVHSLLHLIQSLSAQGAMPQLIAIVSSYAQACDDAPERLIDPMKAALWGLSKVVALEYPETRVIAVDIESERQPAGDPASLVYSELQARHPQPGAWIIYNDGKRLEATLEPAEAPEQTSPLPLRDGGVYLISGGQSGIGLEIARWIAQQKRATLVLLNRTPLDERRTPERAQGIRDLEMLGATVEPIAGDVADLAMLTSLVESIITRHGRLDGVFHAAGVLEDAMLWNMDRARFDRVLRPKVHGTWALAQATRNIPLDFLVICSSMASLSPSPGQSNHVAANAVQDSLAHSLRRAGVPALSINWGLWGETGVVATPRYLEALRARGIYPLTNSEGLAGLEAAMRAGLTQVAFAKPIEADDASTRTSLAAQAQRLALEQRLPALAGATAEIDRLCGRYVARALIRLGLNPLLHSRFTVEQLATQLRIAPRHRRLFARLLMMLVEDGALHVDGDYYLLGDIPDIDGLDEVAEALAQSYPGLAAEISLLRRCGNQLDATLEGRRDPLGLLFPDGSLEGSEAMYERSPFARVYNTVAASAVAEIAAKRSRVRILEVGAGTGGTTSYMLPVLEQYDAEYTFSDVSQIFLQAARRKYAHYAGVRYRLLDLEHDLVAQGEQPASYDAIVAANVLHATTDIAATLARLRQLLAPDGTLVIVELVRPQRWLDLTFGLTEGWWKCSDTALRPDYPLLDQRRWHDVLRQAGFAEITLAGPALVDGPLPVEQAVFIAQASCAMAEANVQPSMPATMATGQTDDTTLSDGNDSSANLRRWIQGLIARHVIRALELDVDSIPPGRSFHNLGLDSLLAVEIANALRHDLEIQLSPTVFFEYPSVRELSDYICTTHAEAARRAFAAHTPVRAPAVDRAPSAAPQHSTAPSLPRGSRDIAIIGMACRFPQAPDLDSFWRLLRSGTDAIEEVPADRWNWHDYFDPVPGTAGKTYSRWGGYLRDIDQFDARFFNISPKEAAFMDPQQRLFLEVAWHALEHAGYAGDALAGTTTGVFVGCSYNHYLQLLSRARPDQVANYFAALGNNHSILANRASFFLNLNGPSIVVDTLCSSSLVALHMACRSIQNGECEAALVGGVNLLLNVDHYLSMSEMRAYAPDGRCKAFNHRADGFVSGEGVGVVVIKSLERALTDGDVIHAVIKGSAVNHNGRTNGLTAPHPRHQAEVIRLAHTEAGWDPATVGYIEAHGTGTALGDPIEVEGLSQVFAPRQVDIPPCYLGSVKTNIGHLEAAAGMAGLIKVILAMKHGEIPPILHFEAPNPHIDLSRTPFQINTAPVRWEAPRRAGISAFGLGGVNAHIALEEAPELPAPPAPQRTAFLLPLSAMNEESLHGLIERYYSHLIVTPEQELLHICYTASVGRRHLHHRLAIVATSRLDLIGKLQTILSGQDKRSLQSMGIFYGTISPEESDGVDDAADIGDLDSFVGLVDLARRYVAGAPIDWERTYAGSGARRVILPAYPFARQRYWFEESASSPAIGDLVMNKDTADDPPIHPLLGIRLP